MKYFCRDCGHEEVEYDGIAAHVQAEHNREPLSGRQLAVGDIIQHKGVDCRVEEILPNDNVLVRPLSWPSLSINVEYRVEKSAWREQVEQPST